MAEWSPSCQKGDNEVCWATADKSEVAAHGMLADTLLHCGLEGANVTAVATQNTRKAWKHKHLPFCLAGIHIRRSLAL